ncbi:protein IL-40 [Rhynchocyon petersi]
MTMLGEPLQSSWEGGYCLGFEGPPQGGAQDSLSTSGQWTKGASDMVPKAPTTPSPSPLPATFSSAGIVPKVLIKYKVLEVFPEHREVLIICGSSFMPLHSTYTLLGSRDIELVKKEANTSNLASFRVRVKLKSRPDLLTYYCKAKTISGRSVTSAPLKLYWELWAKPVSQLQASFALMDVGSGPTVKVTCQVGSGSPPVTYSLVGRDGHVHKQQRPPPGQPASFLFPLTKIPAWLQCQAENNASVLSSAFQLLPPGELPQGPSLVLASSLTSITALTSGKLAWIKWTR